MTPEEDNKLSPVDYFNLYRSWDGDVFDHNKLDYLHWIKPGESLSLNPDSPDQPTFIIDQQTNLLSLAPKKKFPNFQEEIHYTKFMVYTNLYYDGAYRPAQDHIEYTLMNRDIPYIRVGTDYFKQIKKIDRYGVERIMLKPWIKAEIKQDHGSNIIPHIPKFNDFTIEPNNITYRKVIHNCYNVYSEFSHQVHPEPVTSIEVDAPYTHNLIKHIFGTDQYNLGLKYMKVLYEMPKQILPVLCLVSEKRGTGKTTFINWMQMIFGDNFVLINPEDLAASFNSSYATKNIITIDETVIDKISSVEKLKSLATAKSISVNQKHVSHYMIPFFSKIIICTNKEKDFMRIDEEEIRFWVRKVHPIKNIKTNIEDILQKELPKFLRYLVDLPPIDITKSRMVFTAEEIANEYLQVVKRESHSGLRKELELYIQDFFHDNSNLTSFYASPKDIKAEWFKNNHSISTHYIAKVLRDEMKLVAKMTRYAPLGGDPNVKKPGEAFQFDRKDFVSEAVSLNFEVDLPF